MGLLNIIHRMHKRQNLSIREISRLTGVSRNTVTKHLAANTIEPKFATPDRPSKLDPFAEKLAGWLKAEAAKPRKQKRTLKQMHADLVVLGFTGSYNRVAAFAREWRDDRQMESRTTGRGTFVPLHFDPGEAFQFDWSEDHAVIGGERTKLQVAHIKLSHSRAFQVLVLLCAPIFCKPMRCCSTPTGTASVCSAACRRGVSMTARRKSISSSGRNARKRGPRWIASAGANSVQEFGTADQPSVPGHDEPLCVRARVLQSGSRLGVRRRRRPSSGRRPAERSGREERSRRAAATMAADARLPGPGGAERLAGAPLPGAVA